ncbi:MAG: hypothetical protein J6I96_05140 [Oscillospiraceae bacterium]|nr:hypothetical protein [Oscillospiraceae bacterium]
MEVLNKIIPLLLTVVMSVNMTGCRGTAEPTASAAHTTSVTVEQTDTKSETTANKELKQVSVKEFTENIYIDGKHIKFPCTFGELCSSYDFASIEQGSWCYVDENGIYSEQETDMIQYSFQLRLANSETGIESNSGLIACCVTTDVPEKIDESTVIWLDYFPGNEHFDICGLNELSKLDDMIAVLGEDFTINKMGKYEYLENDILVEIDFNTLIEGQPIYSIEYTITNTNSSKNHTSALLSETITDDPSIYFYENVTVDDLSSILQINGKQVSFPCTVSELLDVLGNDCSYTIGQIDSNHNKIITRWNTPEEYIYHDYCIPIVIMHEKDALFDIYIHEKNYTGNINTSLVYPVSYQFVNEYSHVWFSYENLHKAGIDIKIANNIDFNSTIDDVQDLFGKQDLKSSKMALLYNLDIEGYKCSISFGFDDFINPEYRSYKNYEPHLVCILFYFVPDNNSIDEKYIKSQERLPNGYSMDDLLNGIQINEKTLSMPTTLENILSIKDGFSYKLANVYEDLYDSEVTPEEIFTNAESIEYDILYNNSHLLQISIDKNDYYKYGVEKAPISSFGYGFSTLYFDNTDLNFVYLNKIGFDSHYSDIINCLGSPQNPLDNEECNYIFHSNGITYELSFKFICEQDYVDNNSTVSRICINIK